MNTFGVLNAIAVLVFAAAMAAESAVFPQTASAFAESVLFAGSIATVTAISVRRPFARLGHSMTFLLTASL